MNRRSFFGAAVGAGLAIATAPAATARPLRPPGLLSQRMQDLLDLQELGIAVEPDKARELLDLDSGKAIIMLGGAP